MDTYHVVFNTAFNVQQYDSREKKGHTGPLSAEILPFGFRTADGSIADSTFHNRTVANSSLVSTVLSLTVKLSVLLVSNHDSGFEL